MAPRNPVEFVRALVNGNRQPCGNRVQLEDGAGAAIAAGNPLDINLAQYAGAAVGAGNPVDVVDTWEIVEVSDETADDSDKVALTTPAGDLDQILSIRVELTTTATVGARQLAVQIRNAADDILAEYRPRATQAASLTYYYEFAPGLALDTAVYDTTHLTTPIPPTLFLNAGWDVRVWDNNAVDAAADDMIVRVLVARRAV